MTPQETINKLNSLKQYYNDKNEDGYVGFDNEDNEAITMAIQALEQQPCEDCISREAVEKVTWEEPSYDDALNVLTEVRDKVRALPSVKPKFTDEEIQKMQELEQAQLDKAYELGKAESFEEWLSSFNTESATCCFTAVQQLQEKLNGKMD